MLGILRYQDGCRGFGAILLATLGGLILPSVVRRLSLLLLGEEVTGAEGAIHVDLMIGAGGVVLLILLLSLWVVLNWWTVIAVPMQESAIVLLMS